jgi:CopG family nickel-responsive transcriptional regulator
MERFTISLEEQLAADFDRLIHDRGYTNRSEAVRDMLRAAVESHRQVRDEGRHCVASLSYVFNHHARELAERLTGLQHEHHDLCVATMHVHLDHDDCLETLLLRGPAAAVRGFADALVAERGVRHGHLNLISVDVGGEGARFRHADPQAHAHSHGVHAHGPGHLHVHLKPKS